MMTGYKICFPPQGSAGKPEARRKLLASGFWLLASAFLFLSCGPQQSTEPAKESRIVAASGVRVRSEPVETAGEITRLEIGAVVRVLDQSSDWYRVSTPDGKEGWVFGGLTAPFTAPDRDKIYQKIASDRLKAEDASFADLVDLVRFLSAAAGEVEDRGAKAELELARLLAMRRALEEIPFEKQQEPAYAEWLKSHEEDFVYNEPAGQWLVRSDLFWNLREEYSDLPLAEQITWEAANNPLPGECEGYLPCHLAAFNRTLGRYLDLYPGGAHAEEALSDLDESLRVIDGARDADYVPDPEERNEARKELNKLRETISGTSGKEKADLLKLVDDYLKYYG